MTNGNDLKEESFKLVTSRRKKKRHQPAFNQNRKFDSNEPEVEESSVIRWVLFYLMNLAHH